MNVLLDVCYDGVENDLSEFFCLEEEMATQLERIAALETDKKWHWIALVAIAVLGLGWLSWVSMSLISAGNDLRSIKQKVADGLGPITSAIQNPSSPQQLAANLSFVASTIRVKRAEGKQPDQGRINSLSSAVQLVAKENPQVPEVWQAAFQLVSFRSESLKSSLPSKLVDCTTDPGVLIEINNTLDASMPISGHYFADLHDCILKLDDDGTFWNSPLYQFFQEAQKRRPGNGNLIRLTRGIITYSGGNMIPITQLKFLDCVFDFNSPKDIPPNPGRSLASQLLVANIENGSIKLPSGI